MPQVLQPKLWRPLPILLAAGLLAGCRTPSPQPPVEIQTGESVVLGGLEPANLAFAPLLSPPVEVRSTYRAEAPGIIRYEPGRDYILEESGTIRRTQSSRIPDFSTNILWGKEDFRHDQFPGYGNRSFFVYVDYRYRASAPGSMPRDAGTGLLAGTREKLKAGGSVRFVAFGDSITAGGEASEPGLIFWERWANSLRSKYPQAKIESINGATGGDSTVQGLKRLDEKVLRHKPNLVLLAYGMNDHNISGVPLNAFAENLRTMIRRIRTECGAEIVLCSAFPPNPRWHYGSHRMQSYADVTEQVAREQQCAFADVYHRWMTIAARKKPEDLLANNINHPNDFGHGIYFEALRALGL